MRTTKIRKKIAGKPIFKNLAGYNLIEGNRRLIMTSESMSEIAKVRKSLEENFGLDGLTIEKYGAMLEVKIHMGRTYNRFNMIRGYSLWQKIK